MSKNRPKAGMSVTWIEVADAGQLAFAVSYFIERYGKGEFKVHSITNSTGEPVNRYSVTLKQDGKEIQAEWDENELGPKPSDFRPQRIWFNWNLLKVIE